MKKYLSNLLGWKTNRKIIVFESDDWGSFRFKDSDTRNKFLPEIDRDKCWMSFNDTFETAEDLKQLFLVLSSVKDKNGDTAKFTFLMNPANPNFKKIEEDKFRNYHYETFIETLSIKDDGGKVLDLYKKAINDKMIEVGFHGREHLNVKAWMSDLQNKDEVAILGFKHQMWGFSKSYMENLNRGYRATFDMESSEEMESLKKNIREGINFINETFNQKTSYFLAPNGPYHLNLNIELIKNGIQFIGLPKLHQNPNEKQWWKKNLFWLGKKLNSELTVLTRNVIFEPSSPKYENWINSAFFDIKGAFRNGKPAIISTHRANYVGGLNVQNRERNIEQLRKLLNIIVKEFPDVEFMSSSQLGYLINTPNDE